MEVAMGIERIREIQQGMSQHNLAKISSYGTRKNEKSNMTYIANYKNALYFELVCQEKKIGSIINVHTYTHRNKKVHKKI